MDWLPGGFSTAIGFVDNEASRSCDYALAKAKREAFLSVCIEQTERNASLET